MLAQFGTHTMCIDELTGIQSLKQIAPKKRCGSGGERRFHTNCRSEQQSGAEVPNKPTNVGPGHNSRQNVAATNDRHAVRNRFITLP
jgi:hypothetical protein